MNSKLMRFILLSGMLIGLPLLGPALCSVDIHQFLEFPPLTRYVEHTSFSWLLFYIFLIVDFFLVLLLIWKIWFGIHHVQPQKEHRTSHLPWWGWAGLLLCIFGWTLAWTRFEWFHLFQKHTFTIPWLGYILFMNALCHKRSSSCLIVDDPTQFLILFPVSALFWWLFEYLNRFVQNWYYLGIDDFSKIEYILFASFSFSTVLPAVISTYYFLLTFPALNEGLSQCQAISVKRPKRIAVLTLVIAGLSLSCISVWPNLLFPFLWVSPFLLITSFQTLTAEKTIFTKLANGDWREMIVPALAALICGFFWEMWNVKSLAKWEYSIPFVNRFHIFEMPVLGYGGYLPFGLECLVVSQIILKSRR